MEKVGLTLISSLLVGFLLGCTGCASHQVRGAVIQARTAALEPYEAPEAPDHTLPLETARAVAKRHPLSPKAHYDLGLAEYKTRDYRQAIAEFQRTIHLAPQVWQTYSWLGFCYNAIGEPQNACAIFE